MGFILLLALILPILSIPAIYFGGKRSSKSAAFILAFVAVVGIILISLTIPAVFSESNHRYTESYQWIPLLNSELNLFVDGISLPMAYMSLIIVVAAAIFSVSYIKSDKNPATYYALMALLATGLLGVFVTSNFLLFYFFWELMVIPTYFLIGGYGYGNSYKTAFKFLIFTHAGAVFVLLGIGAIFMTTNSLDMFQAQNLLLTTAPDIVKWILLSVTIGFAVKMAIVPLHVWLPETYAESPAPMSALISGVLTSAGAYAIIRISMEVIFPAISATTFAHYYVYGLATFGVISALFGSMVALRETDIKKVIAYSSISHMGYLLFGASLFPIEIAITGTVLHIFAHAMSKSLLFLSSGAITSRLETRDINNMGGLASKMPFTASASTTALLSLAGTPPFACFISEFLIFMGAFQLLEIDSFFIIPTAFMLVASVFSLAYALRFMSKVMFGKSRIEGVVPDATGYMKTSMIILTTLTVLIGILPQLIIYVINTMY